MEPLNDEDRAVVDEFLAAIQEDDQGRLSTSSPFERLLVSPRLLAARTEDHETDRKLSQNLTAVWQGRVHLTSLILKIDWMAGIWTTGELPDLSWYSYFGTDLIGFHVIAKAVLDAVAIVVRDLKVGFKGDDFGRLRRWLEAAPGAADRLGPATTSAIRSVDGWFKGLKVVRDDLVHHNARPLTFFKPGRLLFQIHTDGYVASVRPPYVPSSVMYRDGIVDFTVYALLLLAKLDAFLNRFSESIFKRRADLREVAGVGNPWSERPALAVLKRWAAAN